MASLLLLLNVQHCPYTLRSAAIAWKEYCLVGSSWVLRELFEDAARRSRTFPRCVPWASGAYLRGSSLPSRLGIFFFSSIRSQENQSLAIPERERQRSFPFPHIASVLDDGDMNIS